MKYLRTSFPIALCLLAGSAKADSFSATAEALSAVSPTLAADSIAGVASLHSMKGEMSPEGLEIEGEYLFNSSGDGENRWSVGVSQEFLWPSAYRQGAKLTDATSRMLEAQAIASRRAMATEAEALLISLAETLTRGEIQQQIVENTDSLLNHYTRAFKAGEATILDVNKLRIERARIADSYRRTLAEEEQIRAELAAIAPGSTLPDNNRLLTLFASPLPSAIPADEDILTASALARNAEAEQAEEAARYARASSLPAISLGYAHSFEEGMHFDGLSLGLKLPSYGRGNRVRGSEAEALAARFRQTADAAREASTRRELINRITLQKEALAELQPAVVGVSADRLMGSRIYVDYEKDSMNPEANVQLRLLRRALQGGEISVMEYLTETNYILDAIMECVSLRSEILLNYARLYPLTTPAE